MVQTRGHASFSALVTLATWRLRQSWFLLLITGLGMVAGLLLVCSVPLYSDVAATAGLRNDLNSSPGRADIIVHSTASLVSAHAIDAATQNLNRELQQQQLSSYVQTTQISLQPQSLAITSINHVSRASGDRMSFLGVELDRVSTHIQLLQGRIPHPDTHALEMMVTPETAKDLNLGMSSSLTVNVTFQSETRRPLTLSLPLHIVGIVAPLAINDPYWHGETLEISPLGKNINVYRGVVSNEAILDFFSQVPENQPLKDRILESSVDLLWYYRLNASRISITNLSAINHAIATMGVDIYNDALLHQPTYVENTLVYLPNDNDLLQKYQNRTAIASVPVSAMLVLVLGLILFFVNIMTDLLVERQIDAIAVLRSRGATRVQIIVSFLLQGVGLNIVALVAGPLLAIPAVFLLAHAALPSTDQGALNILSNNPLPRLLELGWLPLIVVVGSLVTMALSLLQATSTDVLSLRRETARTRRRSLLQRLGLDGIAVLLALIGYAFSTYILNTGVLDAHLRLLLLSPLMLFEIVFLALALLLLLMRFFLFALQRAAILVARSRGAALQLALAHMARTPREPVRMTMLLALALAFAIFTLVFTASQTQRQPDIATYQVGADFVGTIAVPGSLVTAPQIQQATSAYEHIHGVSSATLGYTNVVTGANATIALNAVDATTFAQTAQWTEQNSPASLSSLMAQLVVQHARVATEVPAIVDATTWQTLHLVPGKHFILVLSTTGIPVNFVATAEVNFLPLFGSDTLGGVLVDYPTYVAVTRGNIVGGDTSNIAANTVWLRTHDDMTSLQNVRNTLNKGPLQLTNIFDRRAILTQLDHDPLYLDQLGIMTLGALTALLLALLGNLVGSWFRVRVRQTNFAVLRALGATTQQISSTLTWEQGIIYTTALVLGTALGALFSAWIVPLFVFTSVSTQGLSGDISSEEFYARQSIPPVQVIIPSSLLFVLGVLIIICLLSLFTMLRASTSPFIAQKLRLNED